MSLQRNQTRRQFLRTASMASMAGLYVSPFFLELNSVAAMAQGTGGSDYRALVCVYLQGGNDGHGTVIATDPGSFAAFTRARSGAPGLAYPMSELLPITLKTPQSGRTFALNPSLGGVQTLFNAGRAAIVANTGTLVAPATKTQINCQLRSAARFACSRTSIKPPHGRPSPPISAAASASAGAAPSPTPSKP